MRVTKPSPPAFRKQGGFSLTELVLVLIIVGLLAAVGLPRFFDDDPFEHRGFSDELTGAIRYAQQHAVATNCGVRVRIAGGSYELFRPAATNCDSTNPGDFTQAVVHPAKRPNAFAASAPAGISVTAADFVFTPSGAASANQAVTVSAGALSKTINVVASTGYVYE